MLRVILVKDAWYSAEPWTDNKIGYDLFHALGLCFDCVLVRGFRSPNHPWLTIHQ